MRKPTRYKQWRLSKSLRTQTMTVESLVEQAKDFAQKNYVPLEVVRVDFNWKQLYAIVPEPEIEYQNRLKEWAKECERMDKIRAQEKEWRKKSEADQRKADEERKKKEAKELLSSLSILVQDPAVKKLVKKIVED